MRWIAGRAGETRVVGPPAALQFDTAQGYSALVGFLNLIHPNRVQVLGRTELDYLGGLGKNSYEDAVGRLFVQQPAAVVITEDRPPTPGLAEAAESSSTPLIGTAAAGDKLVRELQYYLANRMAERVTVHGVFMEVMGIGVLIAGASGVGKSELALELVTRGHRLIADDAPEFFLVAPDTLSGRCPAPLQDFLEVRGLGILNVHAMFGDNAIKQSKNLRLVIQLERMSDDQVNSIDRLRGSRQVRTVLGVEVPQITLPVVPGSNLAVLVEGAVRNHMLDHKGYKAADSFISRHQQLLEGGE